MFLIICPLYNGKNQTFFGNIIIFLKHSKCQQNAKVMQNYKTKTKMQMLLV